MDEKRQALVAEARTWLGTKYRLGAMIKGVGCDCATLLVGVLQAAGLMTQEQVRQFPGDWWAHTTDEVYMRGMMRNAPMIAETVCRRAIVTEPGNIVLTRSRSSRVFNHGAIITTWPYGIHSVNPQVMEVDLTVDPMWAGRPIVIFDPFREKTA